MKSFCTLIILFAFTLSLSAQNKRDSLLIGSWQVTNYKTEFNQWVADETNTLTFCEDGYYQMKTCYYGCDSIKAITGGAWELNKKQDAIKFSFRHDIPAYEAGFFPDLSNKIISLNDSVMVIESKENDRVVYITFHKISEQELYNDPFNSMVNDTTNYFGLNRIYLVNCADSTKFIEIKPKDYVMLYSKTDYTRKMDILSSKRVQITGTPVCYSDSILRFDSKKKVTNSFFRNNTNKTVIESYPDGDHKQIRTNEITFVQYSSFNKVRAGQISHNLSRIALFTALVVAPLVSIDYKTGNFNSQRYFYWAGAGMAGFCITFPIALSCTPKKYNIAEGPAKSWTNHWYFTMDVKPYTQANSH